VICTEKASNLNQNHLNSDLKSKSQRSLPIVILNQTQMEKMH